MVKVLLHSLFSIVLWCIDLDDCSVLTLRLKPSKDSPLKDWLPLFQIFPASFDRINVTPFSCVASSQARPEQSIVSPVVKLTFPALFHLVSQAPRIASLNLFICLATQPLHFLGPPSSPEGPSGVGLALVLISVTFFIHSTGS